MRKDKIKIIKRINVGKVAEKIDSTAINQKNEDSLRLKLGNAVKDWITESKENSRIEKLFSENNILNWHITLPKPDAGTS